jgi:hypothetical protein
MLYFIHLFCLHIAIEAILLMCLYRKNMFIVLLAFIVDFTFRPIYSNLLVLHVRLRRVVHLSDAIACS